MYFKNSLHKLFFLIALMYVSTYPILSNAEADNSSITSTGIITPSTIAGITFNCVQQATQPVIIFLDDMPIVIPASPIKNCKIGIPGPAGGIIFCVNPSSTNASCHGLEAAPVDQAIGNQTSFTWGCTSGTGNTDITVGNTSSAIGTGAANTAAIIAACGASAPSAAATAAAYSLNGYSDWYLPSKDELNQLYLNSSIMGSFGSYYWSSTEYDSNHAWNQNFINNGVNNGVQTYFDKLYSLQVRAIRTF